MADSLKKSTKVLTSSKNKVLPAPLPQRTQDRLDREAAYEQTKGEVDKWQATMKQIKEVRKVEQRILETDQKCTGRASEFPSPSTRKVCSVQFGINR